MTRNPNFGFCQWKGPFDVVKSVNDLDYLVKVGGANKRFHINTLKEYYTPQVGCTSVVTSFRGGYHDITGEQHDCLQLVHSQFLPPANITCAAVVMPEGEEGYSLYRIETRSSETVGDVLISSNLLPEQRNRVDTLLGEYSGVFSDRVFWMRSQCVTSRSSLRLAILSYSQRWI